MMENESKKTYTFILEEADLEKLSVVVNREDGKRYILSLSKLFAAAVNDDVLNAVDEVVDNGAKKEEKAD